MLFVTLRTPVSSVQGNQKRRGGTYRNQEVVKIGLYQSSGCGRKVRSTKHREGFRTRVLKRQEGLLDTKDLLDLDRDEGGIHTIKMSSRSPSTKRSPTFGQNSI